MTTRGSSAHGTMDKANLNEGVQVRLLELQVRLQVTCVSLCRCGHAVDVDSETPHSEASSLMSVESTPPPPRS
jgi:hypothetical protein